MSTPRANAWQAGTIGAVLIVVLLTLSVVTATPAQWETRTVNVESWNSADASCFWLNPTRFSDHFCLWRSYPEYPMYMNGTFAHGTAPGAPYYAINMTGNPPCNGGGLCRTTINATWESPDHTGQILWEFSNVVNLAVLD